MLWGLTFSLQVPRAVGTLCMVWPLTLPCLWYSSYLWVASLGVGSWPHLCPSYFSWCGLLFLFCGGRVILPLFRLCLEWVSLCVAIALVPLWKVSSGSSHSALSSQLLSHIYNFNHGMCLSAFIHHNKFVKKIKTVLTFCLSPFW